MAGHLIDLAGLLTQPQPPAFFLRVLILDLKTNNRTDPREGESPSLPLPRPYSRYEIRVGGDGCLVITGMLFHLRQYPVNTYVEGAIQNKCTQTVNVSANVFFIHRMESGEDVQVADKMLFYTVLPGAIALFNVVPNEDNINPNRVVIST